MRRHRTPPCEGSIYPPPYTQQQHSGAHIGATRLNPTLRHLCVCVCFRATECGMRNGDALLFLGRRHTHFRENMPAELNVVSSLLLHFVDESFDFFDYKLVRQAKDASI